MITEDELAVLDSPSAAPMGASTGGIIGSTAAPGSVDVTSIATTALDRALRDCLDQLPEEKRELILNRQREAFARRVESRASRASAAFEERKAREDQD